MTASQDLQTSALASLYEDPAAPARLLQEVVERIAQSPNEIWIQRASLRVVLDQLELALARRDAGATLPLFGIPFAVKDNIDVAGMPTTAACPAFSYVPGRSAAAVEHLVEAGAIVVGKTNLDQFATGLVGTRSPYGVCKNAFDERYISGGSSSGSALAVALGLVSFALGTDTAGSGRVPAAFNNIVGLKPTCGLISTRGVVPACRSLDCVSIFAGNCADAAAVLNVAAGFDAADPYSRAVPEIRPSQWSNPPRVGLLKPSDREFFGDDEAARLYDEAAARFATLGATLVPVDFTPFRAAAELLYAGPWVAERLVATGALLDANPDAIQPVIRSILEGAKNKSALDAYRGAYRLAELKRAAEAVWTGVDALLLPTTPTTYTIAELERDPTGLNTRLGHYTNFVNLMDLAAIAVPSGFRKDGLPLGVTLIGRAGTDANLAAWGARFHEAQTTNVGATQTSVANGAPRGRSDHRELLMAVAGAHLSGQPLNHQLTSRGARLVRVCRTSPNYRLYALRTQPPKPGLVFDADYAGSGILLEIWALEAAGFGSFVDEVPAPLAIGTVTLDDGTTVSGFVCEPGALVGATEITDHGGWLAYRASLAAMPR